MLIVNMCSKSKAALRHAGISRKFPEWFGGAVTGGAMPPVTAIRLAVQSPSVPSWLGVCKCTEIS